MNGRATTREERLEQTAAWLNAIPVNAEQQPMISTPDGVDPGVVEDEIEAIKTSLISGVDMVDCFVTRVPVIDAIIAGLTDEELARVRFPGM